MKKPGKGAVSAAHPLAVEAAEDVFAAGGNAVDAAIAAQAVISVVLPQSAGLGGDMLATVNRPGAETVSVNGTGLSPRRMPIERQGAAGETVTVPGLVQGWFDLHDECGVLPMPALLQHAIRLAADGFVVDDDLIRAIEGQRRRISLISPAAEILGLVRGYRWRQPNLAAILSAIAVDGPSAFYRGEGAATMVNAVMARGGSLGVDDFITHASQIRRPVVSRWNGGRVEVQPPSSQGVLLAVVLNWLDGRLGEFAPSVVEHVLVELTASAFELRELCNEGESLLGQPLKVDLERSTNRQGPRAYLHTAGVATVDPTGCCVSSLVSVFDDFGSGIWIPDLGIFMNNRADGFTVGANAAAPSTRPIHTLAPAVVTAATGDRYAIATPGADGQVQTLLQVLVKVRQGVPLADAIAAPRWRSQGGALVIQPEHPKHLDLAARGHILQDCDGGADLFGAVVAAGMRDGKLFATSDWRRQTASGSF